MDPEVEKNIDDNPKKPKKEKKKRTAEEKEQRRKKKEQKKAKKNAISPEPEKAAESGVVKVRGLKIDNEWNV